MVTIMSNVYDGLSEEDRERVFFLAVGIDVHTDSNENFCKPGFSVCADDSDQNWWDSWDADQRDVYFYTRQADGSWEFYCRYSMNTEFDEFDATIRELLADDDLVGNETSISEDEPLCENEPSQLFSDASPFFGGSMFAILLAAVLGWTIV